MTTAFWARGDRTLLTRFSESDHIDHGQADGHRDAPRREENIERRAFALIKKPILNLMTLLSLLGDEHCRVEGVDDVSQPLGVIASRRGQSQVAVLVYSSADRINAGGQRTVALTMKDLPFDRAMLCLYRIDETDGDVFRTWEGLGAPDHPTDDQIEAMRRNQELRAISKPREITIDQGICALDLTVTLPSVTLVLLTADPGTPPEKVTRLRATTYEGRNGHPEVLLTWAGDDSRALRTYEVLAAADPGGPYRRVNTVDQLDTAFVHTIDPACSVYSVRAVDFWDRSGRPSDPFISHIEGDVMTTVQRIGNEHGHAIEAIAGANALDQPRELHRGEGPGRHGHRGHRSTVRSGPRSGMEDLALRRRPRKERRSCLPTSMVRVPSSRYG